MRQSRVFLCYAALDGVAVRQLYQRLRADGFAPWLDEENLQALQPTRAGQRECLLGSEAEAVGEGSGAPG